MKNIILLALILICIAAAFSCSGNPTAGSDTPTEAYKRLYNAVKSKNNDAIKTEMSQKTIAFGKTAAAQYGKPEDEVLKNGFTATTFAESMPAIRGERVKDNMGAVEVWNSRESRWEDLPYVLEDGVWKLAIGEAFGGSYIQPGRGPDSLEKEAANAINGNNVTAVPAPNMNAPPKVITPKVDANSNANPNPKP